MIAVPARILFARRPVDFRKQMDGLAAVCERELGEAPLDGTLFLFTNRQGNALKALVWTHGGFTLVYKKARAGPIFLAVRRRGPRADDAGGAGRSPGGHRPGERAEIEAMES